MLSKELSVEEHIIFLSKRMIEILNKIKSINVNEKEKIKKELGIMVGNPRKENVSRLKELSFYLEEKTLK